MEQTLNPAAVLEAAEADMHALSTRLGLRWRQVPQAALAALSALQQIADTDGFDSAIYAQTAEALARAAWNRALADTRPLDKLLGRARLDAAYALSRVARSARAPHVECTPLARPHTYWKEYRAHGGAA